MPVRLVLRRGAGELLEDAHSTAESVFREPTALGDAHAAAPDLLGVGPRGGLAPPTTLALAFALPWAATARIAAAATAPILLAPGANKIAGGRKRPSGPTAAAGTRGWCCWGCWWLWW